MVGHRDGWLSQSLRLAACVLALAAATALSACGGGSSAKTTAGVKGASEITAEPISSAGANPFTAPAGKDMSGVRPPKQAVSTSGPSTYRGSVPGLYGGTRDYATCDAHKLINFLEHEPSKATAWAGVLGIPVTRIRTYVNRLTPVLLRTDTRVTNHGYANGQATVIQSVLQAGTAVFVNRYGEPVIKSYCGNSLTPPVLYREPVYIGSRWTDFSTTHITITKQSVPHHDQQAVEHEHRPLHALRPGHRHDVQAARRTRRHRRHVDKSDPAAADEPGRNDPAPVDPAVAAPAAAATAPAAERAPRGQLLAEP